MNVDTLWDLEDKYGEMNYQDNKNYKLKTSKRKKKQNDTEIPGHKKT